MRSNQNVKVVIGQTPLDIQSSASVLSAACDSLGYNSMMVVINFGNVAADLTTGVSLTECDTSGGTYTAVSGASFDKAVWPLGTGGDNTVAAMFITLGAGRKRYFKLAYAQTAASAVVMCANFLLFEGDVSPVSATQHGVSYQVVV